MEISYLQKSCSVTGLQVPSVINYRWVYAAGYEAAFIAYHTVGLPLCNLSIFYMIF
jgi:hypothetical protein